MEHGTGNPELNKRRNNYVFQKLPSKEVETNGNMKLFIFIGLLLFLLYLIRNRNPMNEEKTMGTIYRIRKRIFLNRDPSMTAAIVAIIEDTSSYNGSDTEEWYNSSVTLALSDCFRKVTYDFNMENRAGRRQSLYKAHRMAEVINNFVEALKAEVKSIEARKLKPKAKAATAA